MRFHIGFSKFIKPSQIIKWLGVGFVGFLAWIGLTQQQVLASSTFTNVDLSSYITSSPYVSKGMRKTGSSQPLNTPYEDSSTITFNQNSNNYAFLDNQNLLANGSYWRVLDETYYSINTNMCSSVSDTNSLDLWFQIIGRSLSYINDGLSNTNFTQAESYSDLQSVGVEPVFQNGGDSPPVVYSCHIGEYTQGNPNNNSNWGFYDITCIGLPTDDVLGYKIHIYNNLYKNYDVSQLNVSGSYSFQGFFEIPKKYDYQCSYVEPVQPDEPLFPQDAIGSSNIETEGSSGGHCFGEGCASSTVNQSDLYLDWFNDLDISESLQNLLFLPKNLVQLVIDESGSTCTPISINFSSITRRFGGFDYSLQLPCMRTTLSTLLNYQIFTNFTIYNLFDLLIGFGLLIVFVNRFMGVIDNIISGDSLTEYTNL